MNKLYKYKDGKRVVALNKKNCPVCKKEFQPKESKRKYCSIECYYKMKKMRKDRVVWTDEMKEKLSNKYKGKGNPAFGKKGFWNGKKRPKMWGGKHPNYAGGYTNKNGYRIICFEGKKEIPEHRFVMEEYIGRNLTDNEVVHHINKNKLDNRLQNLKLLTRSEHMNLHREDINKK